MTPPLHTRQLPRGLSLIAVGLVVLGMFSSQPLPAGAPIAATEEALSVEVGFGGVYQVGRWTPVNVTAHVGKDQTAGTVTVADVDGRPVTYPLTGGGDRFSGLFQSGRLDASIRISITTVDGRVYERTISAGGERGITCLRQDTELWMLIGRQIGFERAIEQLNAGRSDENQPPAVHGLTIDATAVPTEPAALDGVQLVVVGAEPLSTEQSQCLRDWVQRGGRLVLTAGDDAEAYQRSPIAAWSPVQVGAVYLERQTSALTGKVTAWVPNRGSLRSLDELEVAELGRGAGLTLVDGPTSPVIVRAGYGLGSVTVVGLDLGSPPFLLTSGATANDQPETWSGLPQLCLQLAGRDGGAADPRTADREAQLNPTGVSDLYSQLAGILDEFPAVHRVSNWNVIGLLLLYVLVVGPLDYLVVHKLLKRPQWTWVSLPLWVLLGSWWATALAASRNGDQLLTRQIEVLDVAADTGTHRVTGWLSLYSPSTRRYDLAFRPRPDATDAQVRMAAVGRPEGGFRGMYRRGGLNLGSAGYELDRDSREALAAHVPVDQWSSVAFVGSAVWNQATEDPIATCRMLSDDRGNFIRFDLTHQLPGDLRDWFAVDHLQATFPLQNNPHSQCLESGKTYNLLLHCGQKLLQSHVQGEVSEEQQIKTGVSVYTRSTEYDPQSRDAERLFRVLSFHDAIGGASFTHLGNRTLGPFDFSSLIHLDRLIICGRLSTPVSRFTVDGAPAEPHATDTFVRLVVPIVRETVEAVPLRVTPRD